ncbi:hypothetical protein ABBQ32_003312 [Trebouxia sp. C0010 RCD-2024]
MVKVKGKAKGILQEIAEATASDSKPSDYSNPDVLQKEESSVPLSKVDTESSTGIEKFAEPSAKRAKLHQQLATVERQITDLEAGLASSSSPAYSIFKGYSGLLPGNKRKAGNPVSETIFSDSSVRCL